VPHPVTVERHEAGFGNGEKKLSETARAVADQSASLTGCCPKEWD